MSKDFPVVGLGASAGGLDAFDRFFRAVRPPVGMAFIVIAHIPAARESQLPAILSSTCPLPVAVAKAGGAIEPDRIYVIAPGDVLTIDGERFVTTQRDVAKQSHVVDAFFTSLASARGELSAGVILSGAGADGAVGVKAIKGAGGLTIAQGANGSGPAQDGMPNSAIATGFVDLVLPVEEMPARLVEYFERFKSLKQLIESEAPATEAQQLEQSRRAIFDILRNHVGHDFSGYKFTTFMRRVQRRMQVLQFDSLQAYVERLKADADEVALLFRDLLIGVTSFFRDPEAFEALGELVVPKLVGDKGAGDQVRVWIPGCATGEEAYSLAILFRERTMQMRSPPKVQIFATDIDEHALVTARAGRFPSAAMETVSPERRDRFFLNDAGVYAVSKELRDMCVFSAHSLIRDPPFSRIDLISCRNLLIYLSPGIQERLVPLFHYALRPGGFLFLGTAENVTQHGDLFTPVDKKHRIFARREQAGSVLHFPTLNPGLWPLTFTPSPQPRRDAPVNGPALRRAIENRVLERFAPAHVLVNREGEVLHYSARTGKYLEAAPGQPNRQIMALARRGLRLDLRGALDEARETRRVAKRERVAVEQDDRVQFISLTVEPLTEEGGEEPLFLVLFQDLGPPIDPEEAAHRTARTDADVEQLERELRETRERLQSTIEEYETSLEELKSANEELVSVNEEIQSTNEELETSKEEIQSVNEELHTVNLELNAKVEELDRAHSDLRNLFDSTDIATIFLDRESRIRNFTPPITALFNLIASDCGRPLTDISHRLVGVDLAGEVARVQRSQQQRERRVEHADGESTFLMRIRPYRGADNTVDGVVLTFVDVSRLARAEEHQRVLIAELNHRVRNMLAVVLSVAEQSFVGKKSLEEAAEAVTGRLRALANAHSIISRGEVTAPLRDILQAEAAPYGDGRLRIEGPRISLNPKAAVALGMVAHELTTNAAKHGSLSAGDGFVQVQWRVDDGELVLEWREVDGPPIKQRGKAGFGSKLIERQVSYELNGSTEVAFERDGLRTTFRIPLAKLNGHEDSPP